MLTLSVLYPGRRVVLPRTRHTFTGRVVHVTPRGNVRVRLTARDGKPIAPLVIGVRPDKLESWEANAQDQAGELAFTGY